MRLNRLSRRQAQAGALVVAALMLVLVAFWGARDPYPPTLEKYIRIIEAFSGGGVADFRVDVTDQACPIFSETDFSGVSGRYGDAEVFVGSQGVRVQVMRQPWQFFRTLLIQWDDKGCSAFVEEYSRGLGGM